MLVVQAGSCRLYELFDAHREGGGWRAGSGAVWDLRSNRLRPAGWTSADAAGLPILAGLVRYEEVARGRVDHAIRVTVDRSQASFLWPARHHAGQAGASLPPMGLRLRLRAGVDIGGFPYQARVILQAMRTHGLVVADNGSSGFIGGVPDERWDNDALHQLRRVTLADFEAVDTSGLRISPASAAARGVPPVPRGRRPPPPGPGRGPRPPRPRSCPGSAGASLVTEPRVGSAPGPATPPTTPAPRPRRRPGSAPDPRPAPPAPDRRPRPDRRRPGRPRGRPPHPPAPAPGPGRLPSTGAPPAGTSRTEVPPDPDPTPSRRR